MHAPGQDLLHNISIQYAGLAIESES